MGVVKLLEVDLELLAAVLVHMELLAVLLELVVELKTAEKHCRLSGLRSWLSFVYPCPKSSQTVFWANYYLPITTHLNMGLEGI